MQLKKVVTILILACLLVSLYNIFDKINRSIIDHLRTETSKSAIQGDRVLPPNNALVLKKNNTPLLDFIAYPCLTNNNEPLRLKNGGCVRTVDKTLASATVPENECVELKITEKTPICTYDPKIDRAISGVIRSGGTWERDIVHNFGLALDKNNVTHVLDMGCNIGVYTLKAAKLGKHVVCLDANFENLRLLSKSVTLGKISNYVTLVWNAISDVYTNVSVYNDPSHKNVGGKRIHPIDKISGDEEILAETIMLDDIEPLFRDKTVAFKMDIESCELQALRGGKSFLNNINIRFIQMEFWTHRDGQSGVDIVRIMSDHGFKPFRNCLCQGDLTTVPMKSWPFEMCFVKRI